MFFLILQLLYVEAEEPHSHNAAPLRSALTPTKKVDVDRTVMPDGTIVTTVTTVQSRLKMDRSQGELTFSSVTTNEAPDVARDDTVVVAFRRFPSAFPVQSGGD